MSKLVWRTLLAVCLGAAVLLPVLLLADGASTRAPVPVPNLPPAGCEPHDCYGRCGNVPDGCGGRLDCGSCGVCANERCESGESCANCPLDCLPCPGPTPPPPTPGPTPSPIPGNGAPSAVPGGPYSGRVFAPVLFDGSASSDPQGDGTITQYRWSFGDGRTATGAVVTHEFLLGQTYQVTLEVTDNGGLKHSASTTATIATGDPSQPYFKSQTLHFAPGAQRLDALATLSLGPNNAALYSPRLKVLLSGPQGVVLEATLNTSSYTYAIVGPAPGVWSWKVDYYFRSKADPSAPATLVDSETTELQIGSGSPPPPGGPPPGGGLRITGPSFLWYFGGRTGDGAHPTSITLSANRNDTACTWTLPEGGDKVTLAPSGCTASVSSTHASAHLNDVKVRVDAAGQSSPAFGLSVYTPRRLGSLDGGPGGTTPRGANGYTTRFDLFVTNQFGHDMPRVHLTQHGGSYVDLTANDWLDRLPNQFEVSRFLANGHVDLKLSVDCGNCTPTSVGSVLASGASSAVVRLDSDWFCGLAEYSLDTFLRSDRQVWRRGYVDIGTTFEPRSELNGAEAVQEEVQP